MKTIIFLLLVSPSLAYSTGFKNVSKTEIYKQIFNISSTKNCKKKTDCRMLRRHLIRDNNNCQKAPSDVEVADQQITATFDNKLKIKGRMKFLGIAPAPYRYYLYNAQGGGPVLRARIFISNANQFTTSQITNLKLKLSVAAKIWTRSNPYDYKVNFDFDVTTNKAEATVAVKLVKGFTRGPYFSKWSLNWSSSTIAHEMGHVMGLDDEYSNNPFGGSTAKCNKASLMCSSYGGSPMMYHYYLIFRRALCYK